MPRSYKGYPSRAAYRNAQARRRGYDSYWHERQTARYANRIQQRPVRQRFIQLSKDHPTETWRRKFMEGKTVMIDSASLLWGKGSAVDWQQAASDYGSDLGWDPPLWNPEEAEGGYASLYWYHS